MPVDPECVDLRTFADRFRVWNETEDRRAHEPDDPWDLIIQGAAGFIAPWGGDYLLACTNHSITTRRILAAVPAAVVIQDGSDGQNIQFHVSHFDAVAEILRLKKQRHLSEEHKAKLAESSASFRFRPASKCGVLTPPATFE